MKSGTQTNQIGAKNVQYGVFQRWPNIEQVKCVTHDISDFQFIGGNDRRFLSWKCEEVNQEADCTNADDLHDCGGL